MKQSELRELEWLQDLIGRAQSVYDNDRNPLRANHLIPLLSEAFDLIAKMRSRYPAPPFPQEPNR